MLNYLIIAAIWLFVGIIIGFLKLYQNKKHRFNVTFQPLLFVAGIIIWPLLAFFIIVQEKEYRQIMKQLKNNELRSDLDNELDEIEKTLDDLDLE